MKKTRLIGFVLAALMIAALIPLHLPKVTAEGDITVTVETRAGQNETVDVTETVTTDEDGVKTTEHTAEDYTTSSGMIVDYSGKNTEHPDGLYAFEDHYTSQDANDTYEAEGGSDKSNEYHAPASEIGIQIGEDDVGKSNTVTGDPAKVIETTGDVKESDADGVYDYTVTERITQSVIKVTTKALEITDAHGDVNPDDMEYLHTEIVGTADIDYIDKIGNNASNLEQMGRIDREGHGDLPFIDGYEYIMLGSDQWSKYWTAYLFSTPNEVANPPQYPGPEEDPIFTDANGNSYYARRRHTDFATATAGIRFYKFFLPDGTTITAEDYFADTDVPEEERYFIAAWGMIELFTMVDEDGNLVTTYCADVSNPEEKGFGYNIGNLEDAHYYGEEEAAHIRAIGKKGYWGTESGFGSLEAVKQTMRGSGQFTDDEIDRLTDGMAMNAMQSAIWTYSNWMSDMVFLSAHDVKYWKKPYGSITKNGSVAGPAEDETAELILKLYRYLVELEPEALSEDDINTENTIINEKNFLKSVSLKIVDKPEDHANNRDADKTNDVYLADIDIAFKVKPIEENGDDLILDIQDQNGETIVKARIAGPIQTGEVPVTVTGDGEYRIEGLQLQEGETALKFALSGSQNLKNDVYFFTSEVRDGEDSQPLVGIASGKRDVNIWMDLTFELDVTDEEVKKEHYWRTEKNVPHYVELPVEKDWQDADNQDGVRPKKITLRLFADGTEVKSVEVEPDKNGDWKYTFTELPEFTEDGTKTIKYTVTEDPVPEYGDPEYIETSDGLIKIVNKHTPLTTEISVTKEWKDEENVDGVRPETITVHLLADGAEVDSAEIVPDEGGLWRHTFTGLPKNKNGKEIAYTVTEDPVPEYEAEIENYTITNTHEPETIDIPVKKEWQDGNNTDGVRPESITVHLFADGTEIDSARIVPDNNGDWSHTFTDLPKCKDQGVEIVYTITEDPVPEYETVIENYTITNTYETKKIEIPVTKEWQDEENKDGVRPESITVHLFADGTEVQSATVTPDEEGRWAHTFTDLPRYKDQGGEIVYTITEDPVPEYETVIENYTITNTHEPETIEIPVTKEWKDGENTDGVRPESITVRLLADGTEVQSATVKPDENGRWVHTFTELPKYRDGGVEIVYTITEDPVPAYQTVIENYTITNTHEPEKTAVNGKKTWDDRSNHDRMRPIRITIRLLADGVEVATKTVSEADGWKWSFTDLPKYKDGKEIKYTIKEDRIKGYTATINGYDVINTYGVLTGDNENPTLWIAILAMSLLAAAGLVVLERLYRKRV